MQHILKTRPLALAVTLTAVLAALVAAGCGSDDDSATSSSKAGNGVDLAFVEEMIPHHNSAVAMATIAKERGEHDEIKTLADEIIESQTAEVTQMETIAKTLEADGVTSGDLGVPGAMMGMSGDEMSLETADPFDREFIDMMVPHHQGAIVMARAVLEKGESAEVKQLAETIIAAQSREIGEMNRWRKQWYGAESPAGGVPADSGSEDSSSQGMPGHSM